jgi:hypothetical protein
MEEQQFQQIIKLLKGNKKTLKIIQTMVGFTVGLILTTLIMRLF